MLCCRKTLFAFVLAMAIPVGAAAQTADKTPAPDNPASRSPASAELLKPEQLEAMVADCALSRRIARQHIAGIDLSA
jgi:hypothetical protein